MALSPNYGWAEPDNSSLVKNGAQDIRALGDAIDTSLWNVGYGQAGKNKIINGDFAINQRAFTSVTTSAYGFDRWISFFANGTNTYTPQTFSPGAAPVAGYEATNYARLTSTGQTLSSAATWLRQLIEDVRTFAGQTITVSFWAKAATGTPKIAIECSQNFAAGGSARVDTYAGQVTLSTSWARYSVTVAIPSISGKTIGTGSSLITTLMASAGTDFNVRSGSLGIQSNTFDFWGVQVEAGSVATPFQTATGTIQGELAACQRYYWRQSASGVNNYFTAGGLVESSTSGWATLIAPVTMRVTPTSVDYSGLILSDSAGSGYAPSAVTVFANGSGTNTVRVSTTISGATGGRWAYLRANSTNDYIGLSAEL
jgi:hypothetical protein